MRLFKRKILKEILPFIFLGLAFVAGLFLIFNSGGKSFEFKKEQNNIVEGENKNTESKTQPEIGNVSPISGIACSDFKRRPVAVMISGDTITRPLAGLSEADLVFEMPVVTDGITRMMAIYVCGNPKEIGSIRSSRHDFIPLAQGIDAIYAHWGGSHFALDKLKEGVIDNIDALPNPYNTYYRKSGLSAPHNGFTSMERLIKTIEKLGYRIEGKFEGYAHKESEVKNSKSGILVINYPGESKIKYQYDPEKNSYLRYRAGSKEIDKNNGQQIEAKNIVILRTEIHQIENEYNSVKVLGSGDAYIFLDGKQIAAIWKKPDAQSKLIFYNKDNGREIEFNRGQIWIEIIQMDQGFNWEVG